MKQFGLLVAAAALLTISLSCEKLNGDDPKNNPYKKLTSGNEVPVGSKVRLIYESDTVIPSGKYVTGFTSDQVTIQKDGVGYYFVMPDKSVTITPSYGTQQSHVINLSSGNAATLTANESSTIRMLSGEYSDQIAYINNMGYDLDKNGSPDVVLGFEYDPDDFFGDSMLATFTVAPTNSVEGLRQELLRLCKYRMIILLFHFITPPAQSIARKHGKQLFLNKFSFLRFLWQG